MDRIIKIGDYVVNKFSSFGILDNDAIVDIPLDSIRRRQRMITLSKNYNFKNIFKINWLVNTKISLLK